MASDIEQAFEAVRKGDANLLSDLIAKNPSLATSKGENGVSLLLTACYYRRPDMVRILLASAGPLDIFEASADRRRHGTGGRAARRGPCPGRRVLGRRVHAAAPGVVFRPRGNGQGAARTRGRPGSGLAQPDGPAAAAQRRGQPVARDCQAAGRAWGLLINARQHGGCTPLHAAAFNGDLAMAEYLLAHGADIALKSDDGKTTLDIAVEKGHGALVQWLMGAHAGSGYFSLTVHLTHRNLKFLQRAFESTRCVETGGVVTGRSVSRTGRTRMIGFKAPAAASEYVWFS